MSQKRRTQYISRGIIGRPKKTPASGSEKIMNKVKAWTKGKDVKYCRNWGRYEAVKQIKQSDEV
jgi:hypothetical protein